MIIDVYVHSSKESMWDRGKRAGLSESQLERFIYTAYEVKLTVDVDEEGNSRIVAVDDRAVVSERP